MHLAIPVLFLLSGYRLLSVQAQIQQHKNVAKDLIGLATSSSDDLSASATHDGGHGQEKFFMYAHQPDKKEYEFGFKRGNGYHNIERYEKGGPHHNFKTKVRWHDDKGGHGEHYWDYNHAPKYHDDHHDDHHGGGGGGGDHHGDGHGYSDDHHHDDHGGYHSEPVPDYVPAASSRSLDTSSRIPAIPAFPGITKREGMAHIYDPSDEYLPEVKPTKRKGNKVGVDKDSGLDEKKKKLRATGGKQTYGYASSSVPDAEVLESGEEEEEEESPSVFPALIGFNPYRPPDIASREFRPEGLSTPLRESSVPSAAGRPSRNRAGALTSSASSSAEGKEVAVAKVTSQRPLKASSASSLSFDLESGRIYDEESGVWYSLVPVEG